jgi:xanthine dehydrogenase YagS FAD-binding subunit
MNALTTINAQALAGAVAAARAAVAHGRAFACAGGGPDLWQPPNAGPNPADVLIHLRPGREARTGSVSPTGTRLGGLITLTELADHAAPSGPWAVRREAAASVGAPPIRHVAPRAGNVTPRPWCRYDRQGCPGCKAGGAPCVAGHGAPRPHAIVGGGPSASAHPSALAPALVALQATSEVTGPGGPRRMPAAEGFALVGSKNPNVSCPQDLWTRHRLPLALISLGRSPYSLTHIQEATEEEVGSPWIGSNYWPT